MKVLFLIVFLAQASVCGAQDVATEHTQILNNIQLLQNYYNQVKSLYNEAVMIKNQIESLKSVATFKGDWGGITGALDKVNDIINRGKIQMGSISRYYDELKALKEKLKGASTGSQMEESLNNSVQQNLEGSLKTVDEQSQAMVEESKSLQELLAKNDASVGQTQALQTLNQLTGQLVQQSQQTRQLMAAQIGMQASINSALIEEKRKAKEQGDAIFKPIKNEDSNFHIGDGI